MSKRIVHVCLAGVVCSLVASAGLAASLDTTFTYQGRLKDGGSPANGTYDLTFKLYNVAVAGAPLDTDTAINVNIADGLFTQTVTFDAVHFNGQMLWLGIQVDGGAELAPRQELTAVPYALALPALYTLINATSPNLIGGYSGNAVDPAVVGATISGGGEAGSENNVYDNFGTIGGGKLNTVGNDNADATTEQYATVAGGGGNQATALNATVGGGNTNLASGLESVVTGGKDNQATGNQSVVGGGTNNEASGTRSTVVGGTNNIGSGPRSTVIGGAGNTADGDFSTVVGGTLNEAAGDYSTALGRRAKALHNGSFVWADATDADFASTAPDQFLIRAGGNVGIGTATPGNMLEVEGTDPDIGLDVPSGSASYPELRFKVNNTTEAELAYFKDEQKVWLTNRASGSARRIALDMNGNVGIGTTDPGARLHVSGGGMLLDNGQALLIEDASGSPSTVLTKDATNKVWLGNRSSFSDIGFRVWDSLLSSYVNAMHIDGNGGRVGIGNENPQADLHVTGTPSFGTILVSPNEPANGGSSAVLLSEDDAFDFGFELLYDGALNQLKISGKNNSGTLGPHMVIDRDLGNVGIGTTPIGAKLDVLTAAGHAVTAESAAGGLNGAAILANNTHTSGIGIWSTTDSADANLVLTNQGSGDLIRGFSGPSGGDLLFRVQNDGRTTVSVLEITGGSDLSEQFDVSAPAGELRPGTVVCIDPANPGKLVVSRQAYDRTVAGVISGAGGVKPGMLMGQTGSAADGEHPVALTGRVYVWANSSAGPIRPGDLLTTSDTPGHAMKVTDHAAAQGAILGKAMTGLDDGSGLVLVLVSLQ